MFLSSLPDASGKSLLRKLGFGYMLSPMVAYTSRIIMQAIPARVILTQFWSDLDNCFFNLQLITCSWRPVCQKRGLVTNTNRANAK